MENYGHISSLFQKYLANQLTPVELEELLLYFDLSADDGSLSVLIRQELDKPLDDLESRVVIQSFADEVGRKIFRKTKPKRYLRLGRYLSYAAAILIFLLAYGLYLQKSPNYSALLPSKLMHADIAPGGNRATLTLSDGKTFQLDSAKSGIMINKRKITYPDGTLVWKEKIDHTKREAENGKVGESYNQVTTPRGGMYHVVLNDGTNIWLNSDSKLKYPILFAPDKREVFLEGEAYFEVSGSSGWPFYVKTANQETQVLGTSFNISAYQDLHEIRTTLMDGSVRVSRPSGSFHLLRPGQQAVNKAAEDEISVIKADIGEVDAWHNGYFSFNEKSIVYIMQQVARWYDVDVAYEGDVNNKKFGGVVKRSNTLSHILDIFKETGALTYQIEGRRITIVIK